MSKTKYLKERDVAFAGQLNLFANGIGNYATLLSMSAAQITAQANDASYFTYVVQCQEIIQSSSQQWTSWKNIIRAGGNPPATGAPVMPVFPKSVPSIAPGVEARFRALVKQVKGNVNYNDAMGKALGIEGAQVTPPDLATIQPYLQAIISGTHVHINWGWQGYSAYLDLCELQVDRGDGKGFVLLAFDTTPGYNDTQPFPIAPTQWTYRAIYCVDDAPTGLWSSPVSIMVMQPG